MKQQLAEQKEIAKAAGDITKAINIYTSNQSKEAERRVDQLKIEKAQAEQCGDTAQVKTLETQIKDAETAQIEWSTGGSKKRTLDTATAILTTALAGKSPAEIAVAATSPTINQIIHDKTKDDKALNLLAHATLSALEAKAAGQSAASGALAGVAGEATAMLLSEKVFNKPASQLTQEEREILTAASTLAGGLAAGATNGANLNTAVAGMETSKRAVENNYLSRQDWEDFRDEIASCNGDSDCIDKAKNKYAELDKQRTEQAINDCRLGGDSGDCLSHAKSAAEGVEYGAREIYPNETGRLDSGWVSARIENSYSDSQRKPSEGLLGGELIHSLEKTSSNPEFINQLKSNKELQENFRTLVDSATLAARTDADGMYEFSHNNMEQHPNLMNAEKIVGYYSYFNREKFLEPVYPELWLIPTTAGTILLSITMEDLLCLSTKI